MRAVEAQCDVATAFVRHVEDIAVGHFAEGQGGGQFALGGVLGQQLVEGLVEIAMEHRAACQLGHTCRHDHGSFHLVDSESLEFSFVIGEAEAISCCEGSGQSLNGDELEGTAFNTSHFSHDGAYGFGRGETMDGSGSAAVEKIFGEATIERALRVGGEGTLR